MTSETPSARHLQREGLLDYLNAGNPARIPLEGSPPAHLVIDPTEERLALRVPWPSDASLPDFTAYKHLEGNEVVSSGVRWFEFAVVGAEFLLDAYPILCAAADKIQLDGMTVAEGITEVLKTYAQLLENIGRLSDDQEVGLFAELLALEHVVRVLGPAVGIASWRGSSSEEHDFGFEDFDLEVKGTVSEARRHWISSVTQLQPSVGRPLWLLSIQLTGGGLGARTLPEMADVIRGRLTEPEDRTEFDRLLWATRYDDAHAALYKRRLRLRSAPMVYRVDESFPAVTHETLARSGVPAARIVQVSYQIDVSDLPFAEGPSVLQLIDWE